MAANPKRKGMSTLPVYLPHLASGQRGAPGKATEANAKSHIFVEGGFAPDEASSLAQELADHLRCSSLPPALLDELRGKYTMASEVMVHEAALGTQGRMLHF